MILIDKCNNNNRPKFCCLIMFFMINLLAFAGIILFGVICKFQACQTSEAYFIVASIFGAILFIINIIGSCLSCFGAI